MKLGDVLRARVRREEKQWDGSAGESHAHERAGDYVTEEEIQWIPIQAIDPSPFQARSHFDEKAAEELAASIQLHGLLQPVIVRPRGHRFELIIGERRWRACLRLGWARLPAVVRELPDREAAEMVMIENLQRRDLNPMEEARGYQRLLEDFHLTQQGLAERLGVSQSAIANKLRLLRLPPDIQDYVSAGKLSERHARALLREADDDERRRLARWAIEEDATVRQLEAKVAKASVAPRGRTRRKDIGPVDKFLRRLETLVARAEAGGVAVTMEKEERADSVEIRLHIPGVER